MSNIDKDIEIVEEILKDFNCEEISFTMLFKEKANSISNVLNRLKNLEKREKQAKEQLEETNRNLGYAIQMLTDVKEE